MWGRLWLLAAVIYGSLALGHSIEEISRRYTKRTERGIHLPIVPAIRPAALERRGKAGSIGLGDSVDVVYNVLARVGGAPMPVVLDTGSSDLWVMSSSCFIGCGSGVPLYPQSTFQPAGLNARLLYGDSTTGTYAFGPIGTDVVDVAGLRVSGQYFAAINDTNTTITDGGSAGIFGLGFPANSALWNTIFVDQFLRTGDRDLRRFAPESKGRNLQYIRPHFPDFNFHRPAFPNLSFFNTATEHSNRHFTRQASSISTQIFQSYSTIAPFLGRLVATNEIDPVFSITLQRDAVEIGGNVGQLSIGELPPGVRNESLTWVPVRGYTRAQSGLPAPPDSPDEVYPISWEIPIDDVYLDGEILPRSRLSPAEIGLTALIDTGNSLIRGPADVISEIQNRIGFRFPCSEPHTLAFSIGGKLFPVDPRDFIFQLFTDSVSRCTSNVVATDPPTDGGYLFSWSLGTPFLKGVFSAYHFGNLEYPSRDPPRVGFISTVQEDAGRRLQAAVAAARERDRNFPLNSESAPTGAPTPAGTDSNGVPQASSGSIPTLQAPSSGASRIRSTPVLSGVIVSILALMLSGIFM